MKSRVVAFRVPNDVYKEFERKCKNEEIRPTMKLRELVVSSCIAAYLNGAIGDKLIKTHNSGFIASDFLSEITTLVRNFSDELERKV